jgi:hypothetical protein
VISALLGTALLAQTAAPAQPVPTTDVEARVPGKASVWLANSSPSAISGWYVDGGGTRRYDRMPNCGPTKVTLRPEMTSFAVVRTAGEVRIPGEFGPEPFAVTGDKARLARRNSDQNYRGPIAEVAAPLGGLMGVFVPESGTEHPANQSGWQVGRVATGQKRVVPTLYAPFYIGDGRLADNTPVEFVVPKGSATLCLGIMGESGWSRNEGEFQIVLKFASSRRPQGG